MSREQSERFKLLVEQNEEEEKTLREENLRKLEEMKLENEDKEKKLKEKNQRKLSMLMEENKVQEALMLAKHEEEEKAAMKEEEERAARKVAELEGERNVPSAPSLPSLPDGLVGLDLTEQPDNIDHHYKTTIFTEMHRSQKVRDTRHQRPVSSRFQNAR